ncbi:DUF1405 domain-containing protein [Salibacterium salarium]|uniref:DUF1405 domain-containing protein n=1 Tax=Salibacterium salarium TaxID=284579 RepID=A0A428N537_9BACI|nr:DUF1405 domain-containing protein [Salibacterium salarium]RSL33446.1 DUF1405 domain-containing protein [Salibacterium salarium]
MRLFIRFLGMPSMIAALLIVNTFGTIFGYWWYKIQLEQTPSVFYVFVPDSPTASLFFCFVLLLFLLKKNSGLLEALASVTLIKYGLWAVVMNIAGGIAGDELNWSNYMLIISHFGMALQGLLFAPYYRIKPWHLLVVALWTIHNDIIDYVYGMYPWVSPAISDQISHIGYFTFWLSIFSIAIIYLTSVKRKTFL